MYPDQELMPRLHQGYLVEGRHDLHPGPMLGKGQPSCVALMSHENCTAAAYGTAFSPAAYGAARYTAFSVVHLDVVKVAWLFVM